jgi:hypothetical protein
MSEEELGVAESKPLFRLRDCRVGLLRYPKSEGGHAGVCLNFAGVIDERSDYMMVFDREAEVDQLIFELLQYRQAAWPRIGTGHGIRATGENTGAGLHVIGGDTGDPQA